MVRQVAVAYHRLPVAWVVACLQALGEALAGLDFLLWWGRLVSVPHQFALELRALEHCPGQAWKRSADSEVGQVGPAADRLMQALERVWQVLQLWALQVPAWQRLLGRWDAVAVTSVSMPLLQVLEVVT